MADLPPTLMGATAIKPVERHGWERIRYCLYNPETGEVVSRTPKSWFLIILFYTIYYSCLAAFWSLCMFVFLQTVDLDQPKWQASNGIIGKSPGLGLRPSQTEDLIHSSIIVFNKESKEGAVEKTIPNWQGWKKRVDDFLEVYKNATSEGKGKDCEGRGETANKEHGCKVSLGTLKDCGKGNYGYDQGTPCIYLKLNRIYGLENEPYNDTTSFPDDMPADLKTHIEQQSDKNQVWVNCVGKYPADWEMLNEVKYFPASRGFPAKYFPYMNQNDYLNPLVAVQFRPLWPQANGQLIHIECRAWAKNIGYNRRDKIGIASLELRIMNEESAKVSDKSEL